MKKYKHSPEMEKARREMSKFMETVFKKYDMMSFSEKVKWLEVKDDAAAE
jgi:hypothetical protein